MISAAEDTPDITRSFGLDFDLILSEGFDFVLLGD
jgi:hypothetical protein